MNPLEVIHNGAVVSNDVASALASAYSKGNDPLGIEDYLNEVDVVQESFDSWREFKVDLPEGQIGRWNVVHFRIERDSPGRIRVLLSQGVDRDPGYSLTEDDLFTSLEDENGDIWMSDTRAEILEHQPVVEAINSLYEHTGAPVSVLVNGLGIGMIAGWLERNPKVSRVDVVEMDEEVIALFGSRFSGTKVTIHKGNALTMTWPEDASWDIVWHDIWPSISDENLGDMVHLRQKYKNRSTWQGCWQEEGCRNMRLMFDLMEKSKQGDQEAHERLIQHGIKMGLI